MFNKKFELLYKKGFLFYTTKVFMDRDTKVLYLWTRTLYSSGLTAILDKYGKHCSKEEFLKSI